MKVDGGRESLYDFFAAGACVCAFIALSIPCWQCQGPHPDETELLHSIWGMITQQTALLRDACCFRIGGVRIPYMIHRFHGPYEGYFAIPFMLIWRNTGEAIHAFSVFCGALAVAAVYVLTRELFKNRAVSLLATLLSAISPAFVMGARWGAFTGVLPVSANLFALWAFLRWHRERKAAWLVSGCALLGFGCATRAWLVASVVACLVCAMVYNADIRRACGQRPIRWWLVGTCGAAFAVWFLPHLFANLFHAWGSFRVIKAYNPGLAGGASLFSHFSFWYAWRQQLGGLEDILNGSYLLNMFSDAEPVPQGMQSMLFLGLMAAAAGGIAAVSVVSWIRHGRILKRHAWSLLFFAGYFLACLFSPTNYAGNHLFPVVPLLYVSLAAIPMMAPDRWRKAVWMVLLAACVIGASRWIRYYRWSWRQLRQTEGRGPECSTAIVELSRWLEQRKVSHPVVASEVNFSYNLRYLTGGSVDPEMGYWGPDARTPADPASWAESVAKANGAYFIFAVDQPFRVATLDYISALAKRYGKTFRRVREFPRRDGKMLFLVYTIV